MKKVKWETPKIESLNIAMSTGCCQCGSSELPNNPGCRHGHNTGYGHPCFNGTIAHAACKQGIKHAN